MAGCCDPRAPKPKKINLNGTMVGVMGLEEVIQEVIILDVPGDNLPEELLKRFKKHNYVPDSAEEAYKKVLVEEFNKYKAEIKKESYEVKQGMEIKVLGPGCKNCKTLESAVLKAVEELGVDAKVVKVENPKDIASLGVLMTPGLIINGKIKSTGKVPKLADIINWIKGEIK